jgi:hypothetical protein
MKPVIVSWRIARCSYLDGDKMNESSSATARMKSWLRWFVLTATTYVSELKRLASTGSCEASLPQSPEAKAAAKSQRRRPERLPCFGGPCDGETVVDEGERQIVLPHIVFDDYGQVVRSTNCLYEYVGDGFQFVRRQESVRIVE